MRFLFICFFIAFSAPSLAYEDRSAVVSYVIDGDTFVTQKGDTVRLLNINTPETAKKKRPAQPFADDAKRRLNALVLNKRVTLKFQSRLKDKYGRYLAEVYLPNGVWVNKTLVEEGLAHVYTFPDNALNARPLLDAEFFAREGKKGLWTHPRWQVFKDTQIPDSVVGKFALVEGTVRYAKKIKGRYYLNFGDNWRTDFSVEIPKQYVEKFDDVESVYAGKRVMVRGVVKPVNGRLIRVTHKEQIALLD